MWCILEDFFLQNTLTKTRLILTDRFIYLCHKIRTKKTFSKRREEKYVVKCKFAASKPRSLDWSCICVMQEWYVRLQPANKRNILWKKLAVAQKTRNWFEWRKKNMRSHLYSECDVIIGRSLMQPHNLGNESVQ